MPLVPGTRYAGSQLQPANPPVSRQHIADPVVDALIDKIITAKSREELRTACRAIDRVLRAGHYWVPEWYKPVQNVAMWDKYSAPAVHAKYDDGILDTWWYDKDKAAKIGS